MSLTAISNLFPDFSKMKIPIMPTIIGVFFSACVLEKMLENMQRLPLGVIKLDHPHSSLPGSMKPFCDTLKKHQNIQTIAIC